MNKLDAQRQKEIQQAEELLFAGPQALGFAKGLFQGHFVADWVMPYPRIPPAQQPELDETLTDLRQFLDEHLDPGEIDRKAEIPRSVIDGLGRVGVLGMTAPKEYGGRGFSQMANCKILEEIGRRCASTSVFVNAHHSIGIRALLLFGTHEQKERWLPKLSTGEQLGAFALTEKEAGSDAANVQMQARPSEDGSHFIMNGEKRYITNAAIADVLTVMARTPVPGSDKTAITAFLVTPDMPGFEMLEARMPKMGIRGTATGRFALRDVKVPKENILGPYGKGLKVALTVLDFGRTTFGACCTGAAKTCLRLAIEHANTMRRTTRERGLQKAWTAGKHRLGATVRVPEIPVRSTELRWFGNQLGRLIRRFNVAVNRALITYREPILDMQLVQERIANAAMDLFASTCVLSRLDGEIQFARRNGDAAAPDHSAANLFLRQSFRRIRGFLAGLTNNDDKSVLSTADSCLAELRS